MVLTTCLDCGIEHHFPGNELCDTCKHNKEKQFEMVEAHLIHFPRSTIWDLYKATGVPVRTISDFMSAYYRSSHQLITT